MPGFSAQNFVISGGSFLRAAAGDGSSGNPYQIADVYGLQGIGSSSTLLATNYALANSIDASGTAAWNGGAGFAPIGGNNSDSFTGTLNGNGNTISDLTINASSSLTVGLFGAVGTGGLVENVGLTGGSVSGGFTMGELIGLNSGTVTNSYATGTVNGSFPQNPLVASSAPTRARSPGPTRLVRLTAATSRSRAGSRDQISARSASPTRRAT